MIQDSTYIINDLSGNLWRFSSDKSKNLAYNIMYSDDKWTKDTKLDVAVLDFKVFKDTKENFHIVYKKMDSIKYCMWDGSQWLGKVIYQFDDNTDITELNLVVVDDCIHVFFILTMLNSTPSISYIMHYKSNDNKASIKHICTISPNINTITHYNIGIIDNKNIYLIFADYMNTHTDINRYVYEDDSWVGFKNLHSIESQLLNFYTTVYSNELHILTLTFNSPNYSLIDLYLDSDEEPIHYLLCEDTTRLDNIHFMIVSNTLHCIWTNKNKINYCFFNKEWSFPLKLSEDYSNEICLYNCISLISDGALLHCSRILGTNYPKLRFIYPKESYPKEKVNFIKAQAPAKTINAHEEELRTMKKLVDSSTQSISYLKIKLQEKENSCEELKENLSSALKENESLRKELKIYKDEYEVNLSSSHKGLEQLQNEKVALTDKLEKSSTEIKDLKENIEIMKKQYLELDSKFKTTTNQYKNLQDSLTFNENQYNYLLTNLKLAENKYLSLQETLNSTNYQYTEVQTKLKLTETLYNELNGKFKFNENRYSDVKHSLDQTKQQLLTVTNEKEHLLMALEKLTSEKNRLAIELETENKKSIINKIFK